MKPAFFVKAGGVFLLLVFFASCGPMPQRSDGVLYNPSVIDSRQEELAHGLSEVTTKIVFCGDISITLRSDGSYIPSVSFDPNTGVYQDGQFKLTVSRQIFDGFQRFTLTSVGCAFSDTTPKDNVAEVGGN